MSSVLIQQFFEIVIKLCEILLGTKNLFHKQSFFVLGIHDDLSTMRHCSRLYKYSS